MIQTMIQDHCHDVSYTSIYPSISIYIYYIPVLDDVEHVFFMKQAASFQYGWSLRKEGHSLSFPCKSRCKATNRTIPASSSLDQPGCLTPRLGPSKVQASEAGAWKKIQNIHEPLNNIFSQYI